MPNQVPTLATLVQATAVVLLLVSAAPAAAQFPILYTWPGTSPCDGTLQACIDAAGADDSVEIATDGPIDEEILSYGSLDLQAASGFTPRFAFGRSITANSAGAADQAIRIQGLTVDVTTGTTSYAGTTDGTPKRDVAILTVTDAAPALVESFFPSVVAGG